MPDVPNVSGVPALTSYQSSDSDLVLMTEDALGVFGFLFSPQWTILLDGAPAFEFNSVLRFDYRRETPIASYPVEDGGFQTYDKVVLPYDVRLKLVSGSSPSARQEMIDSILTAQETLDLYDVITPEKVFQSCNIVHISFDRRAENVGLIMADVWFQEVRVTATSTFSNTQSASSKGTVNIGTVQPQSTDANSTNSRVQQSFQDGSWSVN